MLQILQARLFCAHIIPVSQIEGNGSIGLYSNSLVFHHILWNLCFFFFSTPVPSLSFNMHDIKSSFSSSFSNDCIAQLELQKSSRQLSFSSPIFPQLKHLQQDLLVFPSLLLKSLLTYSQSCFWIVWACRLMHNSKSIAPTFTLLWINWVLDAWLSSAGPHRCVGSRYEANVVDWNCAACHILHHGI